ncbi:MAG: EF-P lysine aminoacylase GenX [Deltaproteobacteria bacterium]|nr:MAG: EF-P lysine aminoacylase GenX [Deltaproteobacteria bacterium]
MDKYGAAYLSKKRRALEIRARMINSIRAFFISQGFLEVQTPVRMPSPAPEANIDAVSSGDWYLHTSPELPMKRLLSAGYERIFQLCPCFREGERGALHLPEFTMLEWYRSGADYRTLMADCEALLNSLSKELDKEVLSFKGRTSLLGSGVEKVTVEEAFLRHVGKSPEESLKEGDFDERIAYDIEPTLGSPRPTILKDYPNSQASLSKLKTSNPNVAERFELYIAGLEIANGFSELTDPSEQRRRFKAEIENRKSLGKVIYPMPERFLRELEEMPEAAGIALGIDRLAMLFCDARSIDEVVAFTPEEL